MAEESRLPPQLPGGPDPTKPVPRDPVDGVDLAACARIAAEVSERAEPRATVLARAGLDELRWAEVEKTWMLRIAVALLQNDLGLGQEYDRLFAEAQQALGPSEPTRPLDGYASLVARIEKGEPAGIVVASEGLTLAEWTRLQRAWTSRIARDAALGATFRELVESAKR